ncbi:MAG: pyrimidine-nucleoside phosphorylase, partial [Anaerolineae bacterium]|nr:pyrimidine-nucleoside phosphorylase [Anaerolineae bacterium]
PLGNAVGNALEVKESIETLCGNGPADLVEHCLVIAGYMLRLAGRGERWTNEDQVRELLMEKLNNGEAFERFREMVSTQGGDLSMVDDPSLLPQAKFQKTLHASETGSVSQVAADHVAQAALILGAGRMRKEDAIDHAVGVEVFVHVGDAVQQGQEIARIYANDETTLQDAQQEVLKAIQINNEAVDALPLFYGVIEG